ncbi:nonribosomal peptide synthase [Colletotrichum incanum]|nr:nonribosomal peptide synthase [Colletotrichum incanum]
MCSGAGVKGNLAVTEILRSLISKVLAVPLESIEDDASFVSLGGDSFKAIHLYRNCVHEGLEIRFQDILHKTLTELASLAESSLASTPDAASAYRREQADDSFPQMPMHYDFSRIYDELKIKHGMRAEDVENIYPCSPMQESMYIGQNLGSKRLYRTRGLFEAQSEFNLSHFEAAWNDVVRRHEALRTIYVETSDPSSERLLDAVVLKTRVCKVAVLQVDDVADVKRRFTAGDLEGEFCDKSDSQPSITIYRNTQETEPTQMLFQVDLNHLTVDGSSLLIIIDELVQRLQGSHSTEPAPGYGNYIDYLRNQADEDGALDFWIEYLDGAEPCYFPAMNDNNPGSGGSFEVIEMPLDTSLNDLRTFCRNFNTTISNALQAVWALVLHTYTGDPDVCFGYLSSGRSLPVSGVSEIVGPMMNLLACRVVGIDNKSLSDLLGCLKDDFVNALPHQCFSIGKAQRILGTNEKKLFNTIMTSYYSPPPISNNGGSDFFRLIASHNASDFDLVLKVVYSDLDIRVRLAYSTATLSPAMAKNVSYTFSSILRRLADMTDPSTSVNQATMISPWDMQQVKTWHKQNMPFETLSIPVHQLIDNQCRLQPDAPAVYAWDGELTYRELSDAAMAVAHYIVGLGIGPGAYVALCFEKSKWYSVALLGVLKSGNPFVPIDISNPAARRKEILHQLEISTESGLVICSRDQVASLKSSARHLLVLDDDMLAVIASMDGTQPFPKVSLTDPAYAIFTSGSTGTPKGVVIQHGAYAHAAQAHSAGIHINATSRVLQFASYGFDTSMEDHLTTFIVGACLCVASEEDRLSLPDLSSFASKSRVNWAHLTPSFAELLTPTLIPTMKTMVVGGEPMTAKTIQNWASSQKTKLIQVYGPSECCVTSTISPVMAPNSDPTNIGSAVPGCKTWVVSTNNRNLLQAVGAVGELLVEGPILAKGYLNSPAQTDNSFVRGHDWAPDKRLYKTGDLVRYDSHGQLHFVGRKDGQVKLRGQRIEMGEIERQLAIDPRVQNCLTLVPRSGPCANRLTAVVMLRERFTEVTNGISALDSSIELLGIPWFDHIGCMRDYLLDRLPPYMNPEFWIILKSIPRNSSGKLDRRKVTKYLESLTPKEFADILPQMEENTAERPGTEAEIIMRHIWGEVLNVPEEEIYWNSSFYYLGGDSISAMTISSMSRQSGLDVSATDILRHRSIERLVRASTKLTPHGFTQTTAVDDSVTTTNPFSLSPIQQLHFQASPDGDNLDQQTMVVRVTEKVDQQELLKALQFLLQAHPMLRARFECHNGEWMQRVPTGSVKIESSNCRVRFHNRDELEYIIECVSEAKTSIHLAKGPLVAVDIFETTNKTLMSITIHHLVVDAVSWRIIFRQLETFLVTGKPVSPERSSFQSWSFAQEKFASELELQDVLPPRGHLVDTDLGFWGMNGKTNHFGDTVCYAITLDTGITQLLSSTQATSGIGALEVLVFSTIESFSGIFGRNPFLFTEGHGRELFSSNIDPSDTVGWFTTFSPIVVQHHEDGLRKVHEFLANTPLKGLSYFASRFLSKAGTEAFRDRHFPMEITLNYLGAFQQFEKEDSLFKRCDDVLDAKLSELKRQQRAGSSRHSLISMLAVTKDDQLCIQVEWHKRMKHQPRLADWLLQLEQSLKQTISNLEGKSSPPRISLSKTLPSSVCLGRTQFNNALEIATSRFRLLPCDIEAIYPCSPIQDSLMMSQLKSPNRLYNQRFLFKLSGQEPLDPDRLLLAWKNVVTSQPILRTVFLEDDFGNFLQVVLRSVDPSVEVLSLEDEGDPAKLWKQQSYSTGLKPLGGNILHKLRIYITDNGSTYCLLDKNHLISDGMTSRLLIRNFLAEYNGCSTQKFVAYSNYIDYIQQQDIKNTLQYWTQYLDGATSCYFPRLLQRLPSTNYITDFIRISAVISDKTFLSAACRDLDLTLPVVFQAAWAVVLSVYLNSDDVVFGVLGHGRDIPIVGASEILGPMATIVPMRVRLDSCSSISEILRSVHDDSIEHTSRQVVSLARITHAAERNGDSIFNTLFNFQKATTTSESGNIKSELQFAHDTSEYDIAVCVTEEQDRLRITIESPPHFMSKTQAQRLLMVYEATVHTISSSPKILVRKLSLATQLDQSQLQKWNSTTLEPNKQCVHDMIAETTRRQPLRPAICSWDGDLSYADLDSLSTKLATRLQALGAGPEVIVVLCFEKSLWAVVAMLAVAKSGAAFVHIDPQGAPNRTASVIKQTKSCLGLTSAAQYHKLTSLIKTVVIVNKAAIEKLSSPASGDATTISADPSNTLYVIFTSGTTGIPKGVVIQHKSFCSAVASNRSWLQLKPESRVLQFTNYCFDASLEEIFTVLVAGGCICIPSETERMSDIPGFVARKQVNWAAFTPSFLRTLNPDDLQSVEFITVHAEPMGQDLVARWAGNFHLRPSYGPTECSVTSTVGAPFSVDTDATNIGWPVGCWGWVVHPENHNILVPIGAVGELLLDGPIVGGGYLNDEAKTAAAFINPPTWAAAFNSSTMNDCPRKLYKTGDLVRYAEDGSLLIQRRKDYSQVKIRGQRVELSEIQHHLNNLSEIIRHSMVLIPESGALKGRLVAVASLAVTSSYIEMNSRNQGITIIAKSDLDATVSQNIATMMDEVISLLRKELPQYMVPETWLLVRSLPVQLSLKLDRQSVANWVNNIDERTQQAALDLYHAGSTREKQGSHIEEIVRKIWGEVLDIQPSRIGLDQSFFRLGGDSIYAIRVMRLCKEAGFRITTQDVLGNPTVRQLASVACTAADAPCSIPTPPRSPDSYSSLPPFARLILSTEENIETVTPCSPFQQRMYHAFLEKPQSPYLFNSLVSISSIDGKRGFEVDTLQKAWQQTVDRHAMLRSAFILDSSSNQPFRKVFKKHHVDIAFQPVDSETDAIVQSRNHLDAIRSKLFKGNSPPLSVRIFVMNEGHTLVHFIMGHILIDHVSLAHVFHDFLAFHRGLVQSPAVFPSNFQHYLQHIDRTHDILESNQYWVNKLQGAKPCMVHSETIVNNNSNPHSMGAVDFTLEMTGELRGFLRETGVTLSNLLQFTWAMLLHFHTTHMSVCFGHLISDRDIDLPYADEIVGPMLSIMVAQASFSDATVVLDALRAFQEDGIQHLRHKIFDLTAVERRLGYDIGLFNTLFNFRKVKYSNNHPTANFRSIWKQDPHEQILVLAFNEAESQLDATLTYYESHFSEIAVKTLSEAYCRMLKMICSGQHRTVGSIKSILRS